MRQLIAIGNLVLVASGLCVNLQPMNITETNKELLIRLARNISMNANKFRGKKQ